MKVFSSILLVCCLVGCIPDVPSSIQEDSQPSGDLKSSLVRASNPVVMLPESGAQTQNLAAGRFPTQIGPDCLLDAEFISHPSGVSTIMIHNGALLRKNCYATIGKALLYMQPDGNLVVYDETYNPSKPGQGARWVSGTFGSGSFAFFQPDGNFVVYDSSFDPNRPGQGALMASSTCCGRRYNLHVQEDGNVVIYAPGWQPVWTTNTAH